MEQPISPISQVKPPAVVGAYGEKEYTPLLRDEFMTAAAKIICAIV